MPSITKHAEKALMDVSANKTARIVELERMVRELIGVFVPTIRSEMNLTQGQSGAVIRAKALLKK